MPPTEDSNCPPRELLLRLVMDGVVQDSEALEKHLSTCATCQRVLRHLETLGAPPALFGNETTSNDWTAEFADRRIGRYRLVKLVHARGNSLVYKGIQNTTGQHVAIKLVLPGELPAARGLQWQREARLSGAVRHPNVVRILDADQHAGWEYTVYEWMDGGTLADRLNGNFLSFPQAAQFALDLARGCRALHGHRVLHRDIKPSNVLLGHEGQVKLADFGLARSLEESASLCREQVVGTLGYMSPEQLGLIPHEHSEATDVYGIGAVLYAMLVGRGPFAGSDPNELLVNVTRGEIVPPNRFRRVPNDLQTICLKCLDFNPQDRYSSAHAVVEDLERYLEGRPIKALPPGFIRQSRSFIKRHPRTVLATITLLCLLLFAVWAQTKRAEQLKLAGVEADLRWCLTCDFEMLPTAMTKYQTADEPLRELAAANLLTSPWARVFTIRERIRFALAAPDRTAELLSSDLIEWDVVSPREFTVANRLALQFPDSIGQVPRQLGLEWRRRISTSQSKHEILGLTAALGMFARDVSLEPTDLEAIINAYLLADHETKEASLAAFDHHADAFAKAIVERFRQNSQDRLEGSTEVAAIAELAFQLPGAPPDLIGAALEFAEPPHIVYWAHRFSRSATAAGRLSVQRAVKQRWQQLYQSSADGQAELRRLKASQWPTYGNHQSLRSFIEEGQGIALSDVLAIPALPVDSLPAFIEVCREQQLGIATAKPWILEQRLVVALTIRSADFDWNISLDVPEENLAAELEAHRLRGYYPASVWGRFATDQDTRLLVSLIWSSGEGQTRVTLDEPINELVIKQPPTRENVAEIDRYWLQELALGDLAGSTYAGDSPTQSGQQIPATLRTLCLYREGEWPREQAGEQVAEERLQGTAILSINSEGLQVRERNNRFRGRNRKLWSEPLKLASYPEHVARAQILGFHIEDLIGICDESGQGRVVVRWSKRPPASASKPLARANLALACWLIGEPEPAIMELKASLDLSVRSKLIDVAPLLTARDLANLWESDRISGNSEKVQQTILLMIGKLGPSRESRALLRHLLAGPVFTRTRSAALASAARYAAGKCRLPPHEIQLTQLAVELNAAKRSDLRHGDLIRVSTGQEFVVVDFRNEMQVLGAERLVPLSARAGQTSWLPRYRYAIALRETTYREYRQFLEATDQRLSIPEFVSSPESAVVEVDYYLALRYCQWLNRQSADFATPWGLPPNKTISQQENVNRNLVAFEGFRLPTQEEWEAAVRAGTRTDRFLGNVDSVLRDYANISRLSLPVITPVGELMPNPIGLFDCYGNVLEMCLIRNDGINVEFDSRGNFNPPRVVHARGGSFLTHSMYAASGNRFQILENAKDQNVGFRLAFTLLDESDFQNKETR